MAKDVLVNNILTQSMIDAGATLLAKLDACAVDVTAAFWLYSEDNQSWKLVIASSMVDSQGPRSLYRRIISINDGLADDVEIVSVNDITAMSPGSPIIRSFRNAIRTSHVAGMRLSSSMIDGVFVDDSYIYRVA